MGWDRLEPPLAAVVQGEHAAPAGDHIDDQLGMAPGRKLGRADVDRRAADLAEFHVPVAEDEVALRITHGRGAVAAAAGLVEQDRAVLGGQFADQGQGGGSGVHPFRRLRHRGLPKAFGLDDANELK